MKPEKKAAEMTVSELAKYIDYSVLKPEFTEDQIIELTKDGVALGCATICINPGYIKLCEPYVKGSDTTICPVADFPFGPHHLWSPAFVSARVCRCGAGDPARLGVSRGAPTRLD